MSTSDALGSDGGGAPSPSPGEEGDRDRRDGASRYAYVALAEEIATLIEEGTFRVGSRIPSLRRCARQRGVSVSTVLKAYRLLEDRGLLEARPQSGFYVRPLFHLRLQEPPTPAVPLTACPVEVGDVVTRICEIVTRPEFVPFGAAVPSADLVPTKKLARALSRSVRRAAGPLSSYMLPLGHEGLRRQVARRAFDWGCTVAPDDVLITTGCTEALSLSLRALTRPGDTIVVESPCYFGLLVLAESLHLNVVEVPARPREGIDLEVLGSVLDGPEAVRACVVAPNCHNPLGFVMADESKRRLVELLAEADVPLVEDDTCGDLAFTDRRPVCAKSFDADDGVLLCGSVSKTLAPGYRVGWLIPGRYMEEVRAMQFANTIAGSSPAQAAIAEFLQHGGVDHVLRRLRQTYEENLLRVTMRIAERFPQGTSVSRPQGGFLLWTHIPGIDTFEVYRRALEHKISVVPGHVFSTADHHENCMRLSCAFEWDERADDAIGTLARIVREVRRAA